MKSVTLSAQPGGLHFNPSHCRVMEYSVFMVVCGMWGVFPGLIMSLIHPD